MMNVNGVIDPREFLQRELVRRCKNNPKYSLRGFARALSMAPSTLSMVLSGQRHIAPHTGAEIAGRLKLNPQETEAFVKGCAGLDFLYGENAGSQEFQKLELDKYEYIADWYHLAILSLIDTEDFEPSIRWIAARLDINENEAKMAVERLERLGILDTSGSRWRQIGQPIKVENTISTPATRKHQRQLLEKAIESLENDPMEIRDMSSVTIAIDPKRVPFALEEIRKFRRKLMKTLESEGQRSEVYELTVQIFPVSSRKGQR